MNTYIICIFALQVFCCSLMAGLSSAWLCSVGEKHWYLEYGTSLNSSLTSFLILFTYFILYNTMIPISLIVSLEFVKLFQAFFIEKDIEMYNAKRDVWAKVSTSSINEELG